MLSTKKLIYKILTHIKSNGDLETYSVTTECFAYRRGHIVTVSFVYATPTSTSQRTSIGTLPEGWRPAREMFGFNVNGAGYCVVDSNGTAQVFGGSGQTRVLGTITYVATN